MHKVLPALIGFLALAAPVLHAQQTALFNGADLSGWSGSKTKKFWSVKDGAITGTLDKSNAAGARNNYLIWQGGDVADFELTFKYKLTSLDPKGAATSALVFRANYLPQDKSVLHGYVGRISSLTDPALNPEGGIPNGSLGEGKTPSGMLAMVGQKVVIHFAPPPPQGPPGRIEVVGSLGPEEMLKKIYRPNEWNDYRVRAVGNHIQIFVNGQQTVDVVDELHRAATGLIALELHAFNPTRKTVQFKDLKLEKLKPGADKIVVTETKQPAPPARIMELRDEAQNAIEWALSPLDRALPPDIRQNLVYLREDLLDEAKAGPKALPNAYALATVLCDEILGTIAERSQTSVRAGYSAAQANADVHVDSQSLSARRNYKMSWTQYAREQNERAEILRQQTSEADLKKERVKVDWNTRTEALRKSFDDLYARFREALRQSPPTK